MKRQISVSKRKKRRCSPKQLAALARGRAKRRSHKKRRRVHHSQQSSIMKGVGMAGRKRRKRTRRHHSYSGIGMAGRRHRRHHRYYGLAGRRRHHRRRYSGGRSGGPVETLTQTALMVGGGIVGSMAAKFLPVPVKIKPFVPLAAGLGLSMLPMARKPLIKSLALGMAVIGAISAIKTLVPSVPLLTGDEVMGDEMMGYTEIPQSGEVQEMLGAPAVAGDYEGDIEGDLEGFGAPAVAGDIDGDND
jgi:hypothetical protein